MRVVADGRCLSRAATLSPMVYTLSAREQEDSWGPGYEMWRCLEYSKVYDLHLAPRTLQERGFLNLRASFWENRLQGWQQHRLQNTTWR